MEGVLYVHLMPTALCELQQLITEVINHCTKVWCSECGKNWTVVGTSVGYWIPVGGLYFFILCKWLDVITAFCIFAVFDRKCKVGSENPVWLPKKYAVSSSSLVLGPFVRPWHPCWGGGFHDNWVL